MTAFGEAERLALAYAPADLKDCYYAFFALDGELGHSARSTRDPLPVQLKLAWWRDACGRLPDSRGHPILAALGKSWSGNPAALVALVDAWEEVVVTGRCQSAADALARARGAAIAQISGAEPTMVSDATRIWTLVTLSFDAPDPSERVRMQETAASLASPRLPRKLRPLAVLEGLSRRALAAGRAQLIGDRLSPLAAMRLGIFGR